MRLLSISCLKPCLRETDRVSALVRTCCRHSSHPGSPALAALWFRGLISHALWSIYRGVFGVGMLNIFYGVQFYIRHFCIIVCDFFRSNTVILHNSSLIFEGTCVIGSHL